MLGIVAAHTVKQPLSKIFMTNVTSLHLLPENLQIKNTQTVTFTLYLTLTS